jgi:hypothetical protein
MWPVTWEIAVHCHWEMREHSAALMQMLIQKAGLHGCSAQKTLGPTKMGIVPPPPPPHHPLAAEAGPRHTHLSIVDPLWQRRSAVKCQMLSSSSPWNITWHKFVACQRGIRVGSCPYELGGGCDSQNSASTQVCKIRIASILILGDDDH